MNIIDDLKNRKLFTQVIDTKAVIDALGQGGEESGGGSSGGGSTPVSGSGPALFAASNLGGNDAMMGWECEGTVHYDTITFAVPEEGEAPDSPIVASTQPRGVTRDGGDDELAPVSVQYPTRIDWNKKSLYFTNNGTLYSFDLVALGNKIKNGQVNNRALVQAVEDHFAAEKAGEEVSHWYNPFDLGHRDENTGDNVPDWPIVDDGNTYYQDILKDYLVGNYPDSAKDAHYFGMVGDMESTGEHYGFGAKMYYFDLGTLGIEDHFSRTFDYYNYVYHPDPFGNTDSGLWEEVSYTDAQGNTNNFKPFNGYVETLSDNEKTKQLPYSFVNINQHLNNTPKPPRTMTEEEMDEIQGIIQTIAMLDDIDGGQRSSWLQNQWSAQWNFITPMNISITSSGYLETPDIYGLADGINPLWGIDDKAEQRPLVYPISLVGRGWEDMSSSNGYYFPMLDCSPDPMALLTYFNAASEDEEYNPSHHPYLGVENPDLVTSTQQPVWTASPKKGDIINYGIVLIPFDEGVDLTEEEIELAGNYKCPGGLHHVRYYFKALYYVEVANHDLFPWGKDLGNSEYVDIAVNSYVFNPDYNPNGGGGGSEVMQ